MGICGSLMDIFDPKKREAQKTKNIYVSFIVIFD